MLSLLLVSCATGRKTPESMPNASGPSQSSPHIEAMGPPEPYGPSPSSAETNVSGVETNSTSPAASVLQEPVRIKPIVLVLGPGLADGFAYIGVLQALDRARIPIGAILGTEMGALIGALYSNASSINQFEWSLMRFKEDVFKGKSGFLRLTQGSNDGKKLEQELFRVFGKKDLNQLKIRLEVSFVNKDTNEVVTVHEGRIVEAVRSAMAVPELFSPGQWSNQKMGTVSAATSRPFMTREARALGTGPVVVVDVLPSASRAAGDFDGADLVIRPDMNGISTQDFQKRTEAAFRGKKATHEQLDQLRRLVGLPEGKSPRSQYP